jgi:hypothetical protein
MRQDSSIGPGEVALSHYLRIPKKGNLHRIIMNQEHRLLQMFQRPLPSPNDAGPATRLTESDRRP